jgi:hypothetical protein
VSIDTRDHAVALKTAISSVAFPLYDYGKVPGADGNEGLLPDIYGLLTVERRGGLPLRRAATTGRTGWRTTVRVVGRTTDEARWALKQVSDALNEQTLTIAGLLTTPIQTESEQAPGPDDGRQSALSSWTYAL